MTKKPRPLTPRITHDRAGTAYQMEPLEGFAPPLIEQLALPSPHPTPEELEALPAHVRERYTWDHNYKGPRWTYGRQYATVPPGAILWSDHLSDDYPWGTIDFPWQLKPDEARKHGLELLKSGWVADV